MGKKLKSLIKTIIINSNYECVFKEIGNDKRKFIEHVANGLLSAYNANTSSVEFNTIMHLFISGKRVVGDKKINKSAQFNEECKMSLKLFVPSWIASCVYEELSKNKKP